MTDTPEPGPVSDDPGSPVATSLPAAGTAARRARREAEQRTRRSSPTTTSTTKRLLSTGNTTVPSRDPAAVSRRKRFDPDALAAVEEERDFLLRSLEDLEREHAAGDVDEADYDTLRDDYTVRAAAVLRAIEGNRSTMAANRRPRADLRTVLVGLGVLAFAVVLGVAVTQASGRRGSNDGLTGDVRSSPRDALFDAQDLMGEQKYFEAIKKFDEVPADDREAFAQAQMWKGWLLNITARNASTAGEAQLLRDRSLESLTKAIDTDPALTTARLFRAIVYSDLGKGAEGLADLDKVKPEDVPPGLKQQQEGVRQRLEQQVAGAGQAPPTSTPAGAPVTPAGAAPVTTAPASTPSTTP